MIDFLDRFTRHLEDAERSPLTIQSYLGDLRAFAAWFDETNGDALLPARVTPTDLREFKQHLLLRGRKPSSINRKLATLRTFLRWAADAGLTSGLPAVKMPKTERQVRPGPRWLDRREKNALLRAVERGGSTRDTAAVQLLLSTGLRVQELCTLTWQDVALSERAGMLTVRRGKGGKRRQVPLNRDARSTLLSLGYAERHNDPERLFVGQRGPMTPRGVQAMLSRYGAASRLTGVSPHALRHTFCKDLVDAGVSLEKVAALAGHESLDTTRRYCEPSLKDLERAVEAISEEA
jgi:integrase/recombinase XerC